MFGMQNYWIASAVTAAIKAEPYFIRPSNMTIHSPAHATPIANPFGGKLIIDLFHSFDIISVNGPLNFQLDFQLFV